MQIVSWNVNGIRSCLKKGLLEFIKSDNSDVYCFQEIKISESAITDVCATLTKVLPEYIPFWFCAKKRKGYSGLLILSRIGPGKHKVGLNIPVIDMEARVQLLDFGNFSLLNTYFPHSSRDLTRLDYKVYFNSSFRTYLTTLQKPLIITGDFNVAHEEIDLARPKANVNNAGFTSIERNWFSEFLTSGYVDAFRCFDTSSGNYTWWPYMYNARIRNIGWRLDYFVVSKQLEGKLAGSTILQAVSGSDHCPIKLNMAL